MGVVTLYIEFYRLPVYIMFAHNSVVLTNQNHPENNNNGRVYKLNAYTIPGGPLKTTKQVVTLHYMYIPTYIYTIE